MKKAHLFYITIVFLSTMGFLALTGCGGGGSNSPTPTFGIGGTSSGVLGQGPVLQNNGTDDLEITENGYYRFSSRLKEGSPYSITILSESISSDQSCDVINGEGTVGLNDITDVQIRCVTAFQELSGTTPPNPAYWSSIGEFNRSLVDGSLEYSLSSSSGFANNYIRFLDESCGMISADITITGDGTGTGDKMYGTRLNGCGFHTSTAGEAEGGKTGDVNAAIILRNSEAFFHVYKCLNDDCFNSETSEYLTPGIGGLVSLGEVPVGSTANLLMDWNTIAPNQFTFQLNHGEAIHFDPVAAGATIDATAPNVIEKYLGVKVDHSDPDDSAIMTATFDNIIVNESIYDDFDSATYLDGSLWSKTYGRRVFDSGRLLLETGQEFTGDPGADNRYHDTSYTSHGDLIPNAAIAQADIILDDMNTFVIDLDGDNPALVEAVLEMEFRPPGSDKKDATNTFVIQGILQENPLDTRAMISVTGCADPQCGKKYDIPVERPIFDKTITKGVSYRYRIEPEGEDISITLSNADGSGSETLRLYTSAVSEEFAKTEFTRLRLKTRTRGTDLPSEEAFVRAYFDNIQLGSLIP